MGVFSWNCAHCGHSILGADVDEGINDWMQHAVVLAATGESYLGIYDGYGRIDCEDGDDVSEVMRLGGVMAHQACWEVAGKPEFWSYRERGLTSPASVDQGYFFDEEHDVIDPRVTDEGERARRLVEGRERRARARFDARATEFGLLLRDSRNENSETAWTVWFPTFQDDDGKYRISSRLEDDRLCDPRTFDDEEGAARAARELWSSWVESEEFAKLKARSDELVEVARERWIEKLRKDGRYQVTYRSAQGDTVVRGEDLWTGGRMVSQVVDKVTHKIVAVLDGPDRALGRKTFVSQPGYRGNNSPEWEARVEEFRAAQQESSRLAAEEAARLNAEWAAEGYPVSYAE